MTQGRRITEILTREEITGLLKASDLRGLLAVGTTWAMIAGSFLLVAWAPSALSVLAALVILGGRHLALAILMHDAAHYSLFKTRALNDWVGSWLCAYPTWQHLARYRVHHLKHHKYAGTDQDPDVSLVRGFPLSRRSLGRKLFRDLIGLTGLKRVFGLLAMDFGFIEYTVSSDAKPIPQRGRAWRDVLLTGAKNLHGVVLTNTALFVTLWLSGHPWLYLLWVGSYLTFFSVFVRIRSIAEHAVTGTGLDPFQNTRSTWASPLARITVAPHRVNFHLEHHLLMTVPYFRLPELNRLLRERGALERAHTAENYGEVLKLATRSVAGASA